MRTFFLKILLFILLATCLMWFVLDRYAGYVDYFYIKVSSPAQTSLITGDSRSMQGIQPAIINENLKTEGFELPIFNFCFTVKQAAYGEHYFRSIRKKLDNNTQKGLFILTVSPFELSKRPQDDEQAHVFFEEDQPPHNMHFINIDPNPEYLFRNFNFFHFKAAIRKSSRIHEDGWFQEDNIPTDVKMILDLKKKKIENFKNIALELRPSRYRVQSLDSLVSFLEGHGQVYLVRMPMDREIVEVENDYWKGFDQEMAAIANRHSAHYLDFSVGTNYATYDGAHLTNASGGAFTKALCDSIKDRRHKLKTSNKQ